MVKFNPTKPSLETLPPFDPHYWSLEWEKAVRLSPLQRSQGNQEGWLNFWSHISEGYRDRMQQESVIIDEVLSILIKEGMVTPESIILDIGSGPGTFTIPFARLATHVFALDSAKKMIETLKQEAEHQGVTNLTPLCQSWEECHWVKEFDLVFASCSPAIRNVKSLMKMHHASRRYCCLVTPSGKENFRIRNELWERIFNEPLQSFPSHIIYPFNYLYASGFRPNLRCFKTTVDYEEPVHKCIDWYEHYFKIFTDMTPEVRKIIQHYFEERSVNGIVRSHEERALAVMWWEVVL